jgi:ribonuclease-3
MKAQSGTSRGHGREQSASAASSRASTELETRLGYTFRDPELLARALTHSSANASASNERLEFLGDRVLGLVIAEKLSAEFPADPEGALTIKLHALARREACAKAGETAGLGPHLVADAGKGRYNTQMMADACEAVIAALYLDGGLEAARAFIERNWADQIAALGSDMRDAKTTLQEWSQGQKQNPSAPVYRLVSREGPDHAPRFQVEVTAAGREPETGEGGSKREAEQDAARKMLMKLDLA